MPEGSILLPYRIPLTNKIVVLIVLSLVLVSFAFALEAESAEYKIQPAVVVSQEYNDNVFLQHSDRVDDYITSVVPSLYSTYKAPLWDWDLTLAYDYHHYAKSAISDADASFPKLDLTNHTRLVKEFLFFDIRDSYTRTSLTPVRDFTQESIFINQTDTNTLIVNPYFIVRPSSLLTVTTGYQYRNLWYKDPSAIDRLDSSGYTEAKQELSPRVAMTAGVKYTRTETRIQDYRRTDAYAGPRYEYADGSSIWFHIGNSQFHFEEGERTGRVFWDAGITHAMKTYTLSFNTASTYIDDPLLILRREDRYTMTFKKEAERSVFGLSAALREYKDAATNRTETTGYSTSGNVSHAITLTSKIILDLTAERVKDKLLYTTTDRFLPGVRFEHLLAENFTVSLDYRYADVHSPETDTGNYFTNRWILEIKKQF